MKQISLILLSTFALLSLASCGSGSGYIWHPDNFDPEGVPHKDCYYRGHYESPPLPYNDQIFYNPSTGATLYGIHSL